MKTKSPFVMPHILRRKIRTWERERLPQVRMGTPAQPPLPAHPHRAAEELIRRAQIEADRSRY